MVQILTVPLNVPTWRHVPVTADKPASTDSTVTFLYILLLIARCALGSNVSYSCKRQRRL